MYMVDIITKILSSVGAINWGLIVLFNFNFVEAAFGASPIASLVYILVAVSGVFQLINAIKSIMDRSKYPSL